MSDLKEQIERLKEQTERALLKLKQEAYLAKIKDVMARRNAGLLVLLDSGVIGYATEAASEMFGYGHGELVGQPLEVVIPERYRARHREHFARYRDNPQARPMGGANGQLVKPDLHGLRKDSSEFPVAIGLYPDSELDEDCVIGTLLELPKDA